MPESAVATRKFFVGIRSKKKWSPPIMGLIERDELSDEIVAVHSKRPREHMYRLPNELAGIGFLPEWHTASEVQEQGYKLKDCLKSRKPRLVKGRFTSWNFQGCVFEADTEHHAQALYAKEFGILNVPTANWVTEEVDPETPVGPARPIKPLP